MYRNRTDHRKNEFSTQRLGRIPEEIFNDESILQGSQKFEGAK